jgi:hypothetical protein
MCCVDFFALHFNFQALPHSAVACLLATRLSTLFVYIWMCKQNEKKFPFIEIDLEVEAIKIFFFRV